MSEQLTAEMTEQEVFDFVYKAMVAQGNPSAQRQLDGTHRCLYRGPNGLKCSVGVLLTDEEAVGLDTIYENGVTVEYLYEEGRLPGRLRKHLALLKDLQRAHDAPVGTTSKEVWVLHFKRGAAAIASQRRLTVPEAD